MKTFRCWLVQDLELHRVYCLQFGIYRWSPCNSGNGQWRIMAWSWGIHHMLRIGLIPIWSLNVCEWATCGQCVIYLKQLPKRTSCRLAGSIKVGQGRTVFLISFSLVRSCAHVPFHWFRISILSIDYFFYVLLLATNLDQVRERKFNGLFSIDVGQFVFLNSDVTWYPDRGDGLWV